LTPTGEFDRFGWSEKIEGIENQILEKISKSNPEIPNKMHFSMAFSEFIHFFKKEMNKLAKNHGKDYFLIFLRFVVKIFSKIGFSML
jgi:hypothetical protein